jgi:hypothetical protein
MCVACSLGISPDRECLKTGAYFYLDTLTVASGGDTGREWIFYDAGGSRSQVCLRLRLIDVGSEVYGIHISWMSRR